MPKIKYKDISLNEKKLAIIKHADDICTEYAKEGIELTLRGLFYQFVSRDLFPPEWVDPSTGTTNNMRSYKKLQDIISDARIAGLIDWEHVTDSTRFLRSMATWVNPESILSAVAQQFRTDKWRDQPHRIEVWVEKDALVGVIRRVCEELEVPFLSCRGYVSQSELWESAQRMIGHLGQKQKPIVIHLGDHDPSGIDMTRDVGARLQLFTGRAVKVDRIALNMNQVQQYNPPPNPAKTTDARYKGYEEEHGDESWELDALNPLVIVDLIRKTVLSYRDEAKWRARVEEQEVDRKVLTHISDNYQEIKDTYSEEEE